MQATAGRVPENFHRLHGEEEHIRGHSIETIEASESLLAHAVAIEKSVDLINYLVLRYKVESEDMRTLQMLGVRLFNAAASALKLLLSGYYQTSALQQRDMLETVFLLDYFKSDVTKIAHWRQSDTRVRQKEFAPFVIRKALDERDGHTEKKRDKAYKLLCELAAHPTYIGFRMLAPKPGGNVNLGPFVEVTSLTPVLAETCEDMCSGCGHIHIIFPSEKRGRLRYENRLRGVAS